MVENMVLAKLHIMMADTTKEISKTTLGMEKAYLFGQMEISIKVIGMITKWLDKEDFFGIEVKILVEGLETTKDTEKACWQIKITYSI